MPGEDRAKHLPRIGARHEEAAEVRTLDDARRLTQRPELGRGHAEMGRKAPAEQVLERRSGLPVDRL